MRRGAIVGMGFAVLLALTACGGDTLEFAEGNLDDPEAFLNDVEQQWEQDLDGRDAERHEDARCYLAQDDGDELSSRAYCGPILHEQTRNASLDGRSGDNGQFKLWDRYDFSIAQDEESLTLSDPQLHRRGRTIPPDLDLLRPDDLEPPEDLAAFVQDASDAGDAGGPAQAPVVTTTDMARLDNAAVPDDGTIQTPLTAIEVHEAGTVLTVEDEEAGQVEAAAGEVFRALTVRFTPGPYADDYADADGELVEADASYAVEIDGERTPIFEDEDPDGRTTVVASVPENGDAELVVEADGVEQTLSFETGERTSESAEAFYADDAEASISEDYPSSEDTQGAFTVSQSVSFGDATRTPFHPEHGWAAEDRAWLVIDTSRVSFTWEDSYAVRLDRSRSAHVETPDGETSQDVSSSTETDVFAFGDELTFVFDVPAEESEFELNYQPTMTFQDDSGAASPSSGTATLEQAEIPIELD